MSDEVCKCAKCGFFYFETCINCERIRLGMEPIEYVLKMIEQILEE